MSDRVCGDLRVHRKGVKRVAVLLAPDGERYLLPLLDNVKLVAIDERGLLLTGIEAFRCGRRRGME